MFSSHYYKRNDRYTADSRTGVAKGEPLAAMCVQDVDVQSVLQFTLIHKVGFALHRHTNRVIHRSQLYMLFEFRFRRYF